MILIIGPNHSERTHMKATDKELLRLHIEAIWGVQLPPLEQQDIELLPQSTHPSWKLYVAELADARIHVWRPDVAAAERETMRLRVNEALAFPPAIATMPKVNREVVLSLTASPGLDAKTARSIAHPLTSQDRPLIEAFQAGSSEYYLHQKKHPLIGVVLD